MEQVGDRYLYAVFPPERNGSLLGLDFGQAADDVEFLFPDDNDTRVRRERVRQRSCRSWTSPPSLSPFLSG